MKVHLLMRHYDAEVGICRLEPYPRAPRPIGKLKELNNLMFANTNKTVFVGKDFGNRHERGAKVKFQTWQSQHGSFRFEAGPAGPKRPQRAKPATLAKRGIFGAKRQGS